MGTKKGKGKEAIISTPHLGRSFGPSQSTKDTTLKDLTDNITESEVRVGVTITQHCHTEQFSV